LGESAARLGSGQAAEEGDTFAAGKAQVKPMMPWNLVQQMLAAAAWVLLLGPALSGMPAAAEEPVRVGTCPYTFNTPMPPGTFCVYRGDGRDQRGILCAPDLVAIWSSYSGRARNDTDAIHLAFLSDPDVVIAATPVVPHGEGQNAEVVGYAVDEQAALEPTHGTITLAVPQSAEGDRIRVELSHETRSDAHSACAVTSFTGTFMGVIGDSARSIAVSPVDRRVTSSR